MTTTRFALGLLLALSCMHCAAEAGADEQPDAVDTQASALTTGAGAGGGDTSAPNEAAEKGKGKKKKDTQEFLIVKLEDVLVSN